MASRLSDAERDEIGVGRAAGESLRSIAARLGRHPSTIGREVARFEKWGPRYLPSLAVRISQQRHARRGRCRRPKLAADSALRRVVLDLLERRYSPQQIAGWLRSAHPDEPEMWVSHETIYQAIYVQSRGNLRAELSRQVALRSGRARRRAQPAAGGPVRSGRPWLGLHRPVRGLGRAFGDVQTQPRPPRPHRASRGRLGPPPRPPRPQRHLPGQLGPQIPPRLHIDRLIDRLV